jgi:hypothetical protein
LLLSVCSENAAQPATTPPTVRTITVAAIKCVAETAECVTQAVLGDASLIAHAAERAAMTEGYPVGTTSQEPCWLAGKRLSSLINTEIAAAHGWSPALRFSD